MRQQCQLPAGSVERQPSTRRLSATQRDASRMRRNIIYVLRLWSAALAVALLVWIGNASADNASSNCSMARGLIEKTICDSAKLSELDHQLDAAYRMAQSAPGIDKVALLFDQRDWLRERDAECSTDYAPAGKSATTQRLGMSCVYRRATFHVLELCARHHVSTTPCAKASPTICHQQVHG